MALKIQLLNSVFGSLKIGVNDPVGINEVTQTIKKSEQYEGVVYEIMLDLSFIKESKKYLTDCFYFAGGIDAKVIAQVYAYNPNTYLWELYYVGQVNYQRWDKGETDVIVTLEQAGKDRAVLNLMEMPVDAETLVSENGTVLPDLGTVVSEWHSKVIEKEFTSEPELSAEHQQLDAAALSMPAFLIPLVQDVGFIWYGQFDNSDFKHNEILDSFSTPYGFVGYSNPSAADQLNGAGTDIKYIDMLTNGLSGSIAPVRNPMVVVKEAGTTDVNITIRSKHKIVARNLGGDMDANGSSDVIGNCEVYAWFEHTDKNGVVKDLIKIGQWDMNAIISAGTRESNYETKVYSNGFETEVGDRLLIYNTYRVWGEYEGPTSPDSDGQVSHDLYIQMDKEESSITFLSQTLTPPSDVKAVMIYEAFLKCLQFYTNEVTCFYSELLGRTDLGYAEDGEASLIAINNGHWIRGKYDWVNNPKHKKLFINLSDLIEFVNSYMCVGFGFETVNINGELVGTGDTGLPFGTKVFRLEKREHFYRKELVVSLGRVYNVRERLDPKRYYNLFEYGYIGKLDTKLHNATDEANTLRQGRIPITNTKNQLKIATKMRTSGYQIELQRRLTTSTEDSNHDDEVFATSMIRDGLSFKPRRDEGFAEINNVILPETGYNYILSPGRARKNWLKVIASCLTRHVGEKKLYFSSGQANYRMTTRLDTETELVTEDGDENLEDVVPYYDPIIYDMGNVKFTREQIRAVQLNASGMIEFEDNEGLKYGFLDNNVGVDHNPFKRQAKFNLLKVHQPFPD
jgi:hypothetical protein